MERCGVKILDAKVTGEFLDLLVELWAGDIVAMRTVMTQFEIDFRPGRSLSGRADLRIMDCQHIPSEWMRRVTRPQASLSAPRAS